MPDICGRHGYLGRCNFTFPRSCQSVHVVICVEVLAITDYLVAMLLAQVRGLYRFAQLNNNFRGIVRMTNEMSGLPSLF